MAQPLDVEPPVIVWRTTRLARWGAGVLTGVVGFLVVAFLLGAGLHGSALRISIAPAAAVFVGTCVAYGRYSLRPAIRLDDRFLLITNPWRRVKLDLEQVYRAVPGYSGILVEYLDCGQPRLICGWAVQKANVSSWTGRTTRADLVARTIDARASRARRASSSSADGRVDPPFTGG